MGVQHADIVDLWDRFVQKRATPDELEDLFAFLQQPEHEETFRALLDGYFREGGSEEAFDPGYWEHRIRDITRAAPASVPPVVRPHGYWRRYAAAAALLAALMLVVFWEIAVRRPGSVEVAATAPAANEARFGRLDGAVLTLPRGRQLVLSNRDSGLIAKEGGVAIWVRNGQLEYLRVAEGAEETSPGNIPQHVLSTPRGREFRVILPDGTRIWLNAASSVRYPAVFAGDRRELQLKGEGYFDVAKENTGRPFVVNTSSVDIKVLGTVFNVRAYETDKHTEATLIEGSIEVSLKHDRGRKLLLKPLEKLSVENITGPPDSRPNDRNDSSLYAVNKISAGPDRSNIREIQWMEKKLVFDKRRLDEIVVELSRWYDVEIVITDNELKSREFNGTVTDASLEQVMESLKLTGDFNYLIQDKLVTISPN